MEIIYPNRNELRIGDKNFTSNQIASYEREYSTYIQIIINRITLAANDECMSFVYDCKFFDNIDILRLMMIFKYRMPSITVKTDWQYMTFSWDDYIIECNGNDEYIMV